MAEVIIQPCCNLLSDNDTEMTVASTQYSSDSSDSDLLSGSGDDTPTDTVDRHPSAGSGESPEGESSGIESSSVRSDDFEEDSVGGAVESEGSGIGGEEGSRASDSLKLCDMQKNEEMSTAQLHASYNYFPSLPIINPSLSQPPIRSRTPSYPPEPPTAPPIRSATLPPPRAVETFSIRDGEVIHRDDLCLNPNELAHYLIRRNDSLDTETSSVDDLITIVDLKAFTPSLTTPARAFDFSEPTPPQIVSSANFSLSGSSSANSFGSLSANSFGSSSANSPESYPEEDSNDSEYLPENDDSSKKDVSIGPEFQAEIPDLVLDPDVVSVHEIDEQLLWDPARLSSDEAERYCRSVGQHTRSDCSLGPDVLTLVRDDEQALSLLLQCGYSVDEALSRHQTEATPVSEPLMSSWTFEERTAFVSGLRLYGKDFFLIQRNKVRSRSVAELVQFYYLWKKSDRCGGNGSASTIGSRDRRKSAASMAHASDDLACSTPAEGPSTSCHSMSGVHPVLHTNLKRAHSHDPSSHDLASHDQSRELSSSHDTSSHDVCEYLVTSIADVSLPPCYPWLSPHDHFSRLAPEIPADVDFLSRLRPEFNVAGCSVSSYGVEPHGLSHGLLPGAYHEPYHPGGYQLIASPYNEPYAAADPAAAYGHDFDPCGLQYYAHLQHDTTAAYSDGLNFSVAAFLDSSAYSAGFYGLPLLPPAVDEPTEISPQVELRHSDLHSVGSFAHCVQSSAAQSIATAPLHECSSCVLEPSAKRFKSSHGETHAVPLHHGATDVYANHFAITNLDGVLRYQNAKRDSCSVAMATGGGLGAAAFESGVVVCDGGMDDAMALDGVSGYVFDGGITPPQLIVAAGMSTQ